MPAPYRQPPTFGSGEAAAVVVTLERSAAPARERTLPFTLQQTPWQRGPSTSCPDSLTLYSDIRGELAVSDADTEMLNILRRM
jgi:hypothetical protein